jgi:uncharacterized membrane protein YeaQ/YmgE (transglycosylase-associated protein family)
MASLTIALASLLVSAVIGIIVAAIGRRSNEGIEVSVIATGGAVLGGILGRTLGLYVAFGEFAGILCSIAGAVGLVSVYRSETAGMKMRDVPPPFESGDIATAWTEPPMAVVAPMHSPERSPGILRSLAGAIVWGMLCAFATAVAGFEAHLVGSRWYPQPYEQIPSDFFFIPLGLLVGFVAAGVARLAVRDWGAAAMISCLVLVSFGYAGAMFQYSRVHALPATIVSTFEPATLEPTPCSPDVCPATDPPCQWYVKATLRLTETSGLGATIDRIEVTSYTESTTPGPHRYSKEAADEATRWRGPLVILTGRHIPGPRRLTSNIENTYPLVYAYHSPGGVSRRKILASIYMTDGAGNRRVKGGEWHVQ